MKRLTVLLLLTISLTSTIASDEHFTPAPNTPNARIEPKNILPTPHRVFPAGTASVPLEKVSISAPEGWITRELTRILNEHHIPIVSNAEGGVKIECKLDTADFQNDEAYTLHTTQGKIELIARHEKGLFWGLQTLRQLMTQKSMPTVMIADMPRFPLRGVMHDVGRNYQAPELLKKQIDVLSRYKINVFHFHVADNPGWRMESKLYPQLNAPETMTRRGDKFYTQAEYRDLVAYAKERGITVIPEIDIPGHTLAFRKAFKLKKMNEPQVRKIVADLLREFIAVVPAEDMPYIHIGTDETQAHEFVSKEWLVEWTDILRDAGKHVITWNPGIHYGTDTQMVQQMWTGGARPWKNRPYINSQNTYTNHIDMFEMLSAFTYKDVNNHPSPECLGSIMCVWNDEKVNEEIDIIRMNGVYPSILMFCDFAWGWGGAPKAHTQYMPNLPKKSETNLLQRAVVLENKIIAHRDAFFAKEPFPYVRQTNIEWRLFSYDPKVVSPKLHLPSANDIRAVYPTGTWMKDIYMGATIYPQHFWYPAVCPVPKGGNFFYAYTRIWSDKDQDVGAWIGFHAWSRAFGQRRGGPQPKLGEWSVSGAEIYLNGAPIPPPKWTRPGFRATDEETPLVDQDYQFRPPTPIHLKKGWNEVFIKAPKSNKLWKWVFTFTPVIATENLNVIEVPNLKFDASFSDTEEALIQKGIVPAEIEAGAASIKIENFKASPVGKFQKLATALGDFECVPAQSAEIIPGAVKMTGSANLSLIFYDVERVEVLTFDLTYRTAPQKFTLEKLVNGKWIQVWTRGNTLPSKNLKFTLKEKDLKGLRFKVESDPNSESVVELTNIQLNEGCFNDPQRKLAP